MAVVALYSVKGGVGKTTLAANLAWCSATISCRRTLLWDLDAGGGSAFLLGVEPNRRDRASDVFDGQREPAELISATGFEDLHVLPADESIRALDAQFAGIGKRKRLAKLTGKLARDYERIVLDCPPVLNEISAQVMRAADVIIVPLPPSPLSSRAFDTVVTAVRSIGKGHPPILPVLSMVDLRRNLHRETCAANRGWPVIPMASVVEQCAIRREPVGAFAPKSPAAGAFARLWTAIERKLAKR
ncbi:AAA family ATPase [Altererythrobacter aurantiacus]|uniref:AAA family ATPase n=1 Tax=Parapontixanthobacter aurantiacus TaxID=1463599 RepID=A0A844ZF00_9SPHN|nr:ParA family protein [Parapontixanthobacter aurantiacus]MXO86358.1 AAA family ATPase [Parapontixanthobacter aurantiacus]